MLFNSIDFAVFLPIVFGLYWFVFQRNIKQQNVLVLAASYLFYGWWDWRFLSLIIFSTLVDYFIGIQLSNQENRKKRKALLWASILINLGFLGFFKYYNFFVDNFVEAFSWFGAEIEVGLLNIVLPVGISFYTFQTLSYSIDVYQRKLEPTKDLIAFSAFVSFFPQLVAGPIERASNLLPQFFEKRSFDFSNAVRGMRQILWGLFKKVVIADNCAEYANMIFNNSSDFSGSTHLLGALFFTFQIYGDFSGYSDIAIGTSRLFGFNLMRNFSFPYFSRDIAEFWRRWHISLTTWFRDYVYIPLGGSQGGIRRKVRNTFLIFLLSGFWHGANWTFIVWGLLNAIYFLPLLLRQNNRKHLEIVAQGRNLPSIREFFAILSTFGLTVLAWIFFRADSVSHAFAFIRTIFSKSLFTTPDFYGKKMAIVTIVYIFLLLVTEWRGRESEFALDIPFKNKRFRWAFYYFLMISIACFSGKEVQFIYFQF